MTETTQSQEEKNQVVVRKRRHLSVVWIIPIVAALIGGWLAWKTANERGPVITIRFDTAAGLEPGKTRIRYRDMDIGQVDEVRLDEDLVHVIVTARMDKSASPFLTQSASFWIVRARISATEISGLGTLFSGAYIAMAPGKDQVSTRNFIGLESPPVFSTDRPGRYYLLRAKRLGSLDVGAPVYYRQIQVGQVVNYNLNETGDGVDVRIFIEGPHQNKILKDTRFWNANGVDINLDANGIKIDTESLITILSGGIAFETPYSAGPKQPAEEDTVFQLYPNQSSIYEKEFKKKQNLVMFFDESVRGLVPGAPVEFRGIRIGQVTGVDIELDMNNMEFRIPVLVEIEPERIKVSGGGSFDEKDVLDKLVKRGLRAQLKLASLITGQLAVSFDIFPDSPPAQIAYTGSTAIMPTAATPIEELTGSISRLLKRIEKLPFEEITDGLNKSLATLDSTLSDMRNTSADFRGTLTPAAVSSLEQLNRTLEELRQNFGTDSSVTLEANKTLNELSRAARSVRTLTDYLERHPESMIRGKEENQP